MKAEELLLALNELEEDLIEDASVPLPRRGVPRRKLMALLTAALVAGTLVLTVFASSDTTLRLRDFFTWRSDFPLSDSQQTYIDDHAVAVQNSQTRDGYTLTLDTAISDGICTYIRFQLTAPEGTVLDARHYGPRERTALVNKEGERFMGSGGFTTMDDGLADNTVTLVYQLFHTWDENNYDSVYGDTWSLRFEGITGTYIHGYGTSEISIEETVLTDAIWDFTITFPEQGNEAVELITEPVPCPCLINLGIQGWHYEDVTITSLKVRALSAALTFRHPKAESLNGRFDDIWAVMKDGSRAQLHAASGAPNHLTFHFDAPIVLTQVDYILLPNGTRLPMPQE